jgi:pimeloyl-ACP methyl ester carboxylesterase
MAILACAGYRVLALDLPGTPLSRTSRQPLAEQVKADLLVQFINAQHLQRVIIFGASWGECVCTCACSVRTGGTFAIPFLLAHSARLHALVAVCSVGSHLADARTYNNLTVRTNHS